MVETPDTGQRRVGRIARILWLLVGIIVGLIGYFDFEEKVSFFRFMLTTFPWEMATIFALGFALTSRAEVLALLQLIAKFSFRALQRIWPIITALAGPVAIVGAVVGLTFLFHKIDDGDLTIEQGIARVETRLERTRDDYVSKFNRVVLRIYHRPAFYSRAITDGYRLYQMRRGQEALANGNLELAIRNFSGAASWYPESSQAANAVAWRDVVLSRQVYARNQYTRAAAIYAREHLTPYGLALTLTALRADPRHRDAATLMSQQLDDLRRTELFTTRIITGCLTLEGSDLRPADPVELSMALETATGPADTAFISSGDYSTFCARILTLRDLMVTADIEPNEDVEFASFTEMETEAQAELLGRYLAEHRWALRHICARLEELPASRSRADEDICLFQYNIEFEETEFWQTP